MNSTFKYTQAFEKLRFIFNGCSFEPSTFTSIQHCGMHWNNKNNNILKMLPLLFF